MKIVEYPQLTEDMIDRARHTISTEEKTRPACFSVLTEDVIRRWAYMLGDANPLWLDADYAAKTRWNSIVSPPTLPETAVRGPLFNPLRAQRQGGDLRRSTAPPPGSSRGGGLPGIATLQVGREFRFYEPVLAGEEIRGTSRVVAIVDSNGRQPGDCIEADCDVDGAMDAGLQESPWPDSRFVIQTFEHKVYSKRSGKLLMRTYRHEGRFPRGIPMELSKYRDRAEVPYWSDAAMDAILEVHENEFLRGSDTLYIEDIKVGDDIPQIVKGPHTMNDHILYHAAFGGWFDVTDRIKYLLLSRFPAAGVIDPETNVPEFPNMMHFDHHSAVSMGMPRGFDGSMQRISWFGHLVTNWMGDDAVMESLEVLHSKPLFLLDAVWLHGRVVKVDVEDRRASLDLWGINQFGDRISSGSATVILQSRNTLGDGNKGTA